MERKIHLPSNETLGEPIVFEMGPDGRAVRFKRHSNYQLRVR